MDSFTAVIQQADGWWIGWVEEIQGVNAQEKTEKALMQSLRETLAEAIEMNREEARSSAQGDFSEVCFAL